MIIIADLLAELRSVDEFILLEEDEAASIVNYIDSLYHDIAKLNQDIKEANKERYDTYEELVHLKQAFAVLQGEWTLALSKLEQLENK